MFKVYICTNDSVNIPNLTLARSPQHAWTQLKPVLEAKGWVEPAPEQIGEKDGKPIWKEFKPEFKHYDTDKPGSYIIRSGE